MPIGELAIRQVVIAPQETSVLEAAKLMRQYHVGDIVVTRESERKRHPVDIVTDRDIVLEVLAQGIDDTKVSVGDLVTSGRMKASSRRSS